MINKTISNRNEEKETDEKSTDEEQVWIVPSQNDPRIIGLYGEINEDSARSCIVDLLAMHENGKNEDEEGRKTYEPFEFILSTEGGYVAEMFSIYDVMRRVKGEGTEIHTYGLGKIMSAGVLLLAGGTKGSRRLGRNAQIMMHDISSGHFGSMKEIQNDTKQARKLRDIYIDCLASETKMTKRKINYYFNKHIDVYFTAEEALELGIIDEII